MTLQVNGEEHSVRSHPRAALLWVLRDEIGCSSVKYGCGAGQCGACRVVIDGTLSYSCLVTVAETDGREVRTLEGYIADGTADPIVDALLALDAGQCGYCLPGIAITLTLLRERTAAPTRAELMRSLDDHLCRCGAHSRIVSAACSALGIGDG